MQNNNFNINDEDFIIGKGFSVEETASKEKKKSKGKKHSVLKNIIWIASILIVSVWLAVTIVIGLFDYVGLGFGRGEKVELYIEEGDSTSEIAEKLNNVGAVQMPFLFKMYSKLNDYDSKYKYGLYTFNNEAGYSKIADMLVNNGAKADSVKVTIPEGTGINDYTHIVDGEEKTIKGLATILEENEVCTRKDFFEALDEVKATGDLLKNCDEDKTYYMLEGYLFPDTYEFYAYDFSDEDDSYECASMVIEKMINTMEGKITDEMYARADEMGYTMNEILTMASIIQMESGQSTDSMKDVAAIFYNRLDSKNFSTLGSSPTCYYGNSFKHDNGRYDTYKVEGLPPGPLCSPGLDAINAALYPSTDKEGFYYFVTDKNGNFYFHKTLAEQNATIAKLQRDDNWVYETFE